MDKFAGDIAIVTGGSSGIGQALIKRLLEKSEDLIVVGLARRSIDGFSSFSNFRGYKCDLTQAAEIESALSELKKEFPEKTIQILINNGGAAKPLPLIDHPDLNDSATIEVQSLEDVSKIYATTINVNILGTSLMTRAVSSLMNHQKCGNIINMNSLFGHTVPSMQNAHLYSATKFAISALTEGVRQELRTIKSAIRANQISPGFVDTPFPEQFSKNPEYLAQMKEIMKTALTTDDVADSVMLCIEAQPGCQIGDVQLNPLSQVF